MIFELFSWISLLCFSEQIGISKLLKLKKEKKFSDTSGSVLFTSLISSSDLFNVGSFLSLSSGSSSIFKLLWGSSIIQKPPLMNIYLGNQISFKLKVCKLNSTYYKISTGRFSAAICINLILFQHFHSVAEGSY